MEFMIDDASLEEIERAVDIFPITGVTSNPTILKAAGKTDLFQHLLRIREIIGCERSLHVQVVAESAEDMVREAEAIVEHVDSSVFIKIPTTEQGLKAMRLLKKRGANVTATAIYLKIQGLMAIACGVDYLAPYYNRMENLDMNPNSVIALFRAMIDENRAETKILAASFKNMTQVTKAFESGTHCATVQPSLLHSAFATSEIHKAVDDFHADWVSMQGDVPINELCRKCLASVEDSSWLNQPW